MDGNPVTKPIQPPGMMHASHPSGGSAAGMEMKIAFKFEREIKWTYRFLEEADSFVVGTLYVRQSAFDHRPSRIEVTIRTLE